MGEMKKLRELCLRITDGSHYSPPASTKGYPMLSSKDMGDMDFDYSNVKYIDENEFKKMVSSGCKPLVNDVLIIKDGNSYLQKVFVVTEEKDIALLSSIGILRPKVDILDPYYLRYYLLSDFVKHEVAKKYVTGSALPRIILDNFGDIDIPYVGINEQKKLVMILKDIDFKIENNKTICSDLESMAKLLYDYWFVQFDFPDENGRPYKSSGGKMVWNEELKREIPEGWKSGYFRDMLDIGNGRDHKSLADGNIPVYGSGGLMRKANTSLYTGESVLIPRKGTLNNIMYVNEAFWTVDTMFYTKMKHKNIAKYMYYATKVYDFEKLNTGTGVPSMTTDIIYKLKVLIPAASVLERFDTMLSPMYKAIKQYTEENQQLASLRDFLLPMLMNGQVKVGKAGE